MGPIAESLQTGDWAQAETLQAAINALKGGKGGFRKGLGKGSPGKGAASPGKGAEGNAEFNGVCHHCGIWGHRRQECRRLDTEMAKKGGGKGDKGGGKGGKGGPKGGKGPIMECAAEDDWTGEGLAGDEDLAGEAWYFDSIIGCVVDAGPAQTPARAGPLGCGSRGSFRAPGGRSSAPPPPPPLPPPPPPPPPRPYGPAFHPLPSPIPPPPSYLQKPSSHY